MRVWGSKSSMVLAAACMLLGMHAAAQPGHEAKKRDQVYTRPHPQSVVMRLTPEQLKFVAVTPATQRSFVDALEAVGNIDFNQDRTVQVTPPYQGRVVQVFAQAGDEVSKGKPLFSVDSPDLAQACSAAIAAQGVLDVTTAAAERARQLYEIQGVALKDYQQAVSDQQTAEANMKGARDALRIFGKSPAQIDVLIKSRQVDGRLAVTSPLTGRVTAKTVAAGSLVQPGMAIAPYTVADLATKWMLANVAERDVPSLRVGQTVDVSLLAYPGRTFKGRISYVASMLDPMTHRLTVRSEVQDPRNELQPQMLASFRVHTGQAASSVAIPLDGVVREGDGTITVWVTGNRQDFEPRTVKLGLQQEGYFQVLEGLSVGELVAGKGALFISNARALSQH